MKSKRFDHLIKKLLMLTAFFSVAFLASCGDDEAVTPAPSVINFTSPSGVVSESSTAPLMVSLSLDKDASAAGTIKVTIAGATYDTDYTTSAESASFDLDVAKDAKFVSFSILPKDNDLLDGDKTLTITLSDATGGVKLGTSVTYTASIQDDEGPTAISFKEETKSIMKDNGVVTVELELIMAAIGAGTVDVTIASTDATYGTDFTTDPDGTSGKITLDIASSATSSSFTITPLDTDGAKTITFTLSNPTGAIELGTSKIVYTLNVIEEAVTSIADIRALYNGTDDFEITTDMLIRGKVVSTMEANNGQNIVIQDESAGIVVRFDEDHVFAQGTDLEINLNGSTISDFNGLVQIVGDLPLTDATDKLGDGIVPTATLLTIEQLNSGSFESQLVSLESVSFAAADGVKTLNGNNDLTDGQLTSVMRVTASTFRDNILPLGSGTVSGVAGTFSGTAQLLPQTATDVFTSNPTVIITVTGTIADFGSVDTGANSASQTYTVKGMMLTEGITITAPSMFEVSLNNTDFSSSVLVDAADAMAGEVSVYTRYSPASGLATMHSGDITHQTAGAEVKKLAVSGTELAMAFVPTGTGAYFSEYAEGSSNNKYVEIFNPTGTMIDLSEYQLWGSNNGGDWKEERKLQLVGTIAPGAVFVVSTDQAVQAILDFADMERPFESPVHYNGDDAVGLFKSDGAGGFDLVDVIGVPTEDPGSSWEVAGNTGATANHTMVRKPTVDKGNTDWATSAGTDAGDSEWIVLDIDTWTNLGFHVSE